LYSNLGIRVAWLTGLTLQLLHQLESAVDTDTIVTIGSTGRGPHPAINVFMLDD
jgi:hypothetical protein